MIELLSAAIERSRKGEEGAILAAELAALTVLVAVAVAGVSGLLTGVLGTVFTGLGGIVAALLGAL
ncbi:MAG: hypothetical protein ACT4OS_11980 [Acidimicrobiales bacterium]